MKRLLVIAGIGLFLSRTIWHQVHLLAKISRYFERSDTPDTDAWLPSIALAGTMKYSRARTIVVLAGLVRSTNSIKSKTWRMLAELACLHSVVIHLLVDEINHNTSLVSELATFSGTSSECFSPILETEEFILPKMGPGEPNRVQKLAFIRDAQRRRIQQLYFNSTAKNGESNMTPLIEPNREHSVIILADLDLSVLPNADQVMKRVNFIASLDKSKIAPPHVICAFGQYIRSDRYKDHYYDTFATAFLNDSFVYMEKHRVMKHYDGEDLNVSSMDGPSISNYVRSLARRNPLGLAPARSCFSGLAVYRASVYLAPQCQYSLHFHENKQFMDDQPRDLNGELSVMRYASLKYNAPCEHMVFHDCLHRKVFSRRNYSHDKDDENQGDASMYIDPMFSTFWKQDAQP